MHTTELIQRVERLYYDYADGVDTADLEVLRNVFTDDVVFVTNRGRMASGIEDLLTTYEPLLAQGGTVSRHVVSNIRVMDITDGLIQTHAYFTATFHEVSRVRILTGCYRDIHIETDQGLRIQRKHVELDPAVTL